MKQKLSTAALVKFKDAFEKYLGNYWSITVYDSRPTAHLHGAAKLEGDQRDWFDPPQEFVSAALLGVYVIVAADGRWFLHWNDTTDGEEHETEGTVLEGRDGEIRTVRMIVRKIAEVMKEDDH